MNELWQQKDGDIITLGLTAETQEEAGDIAFANIADLGAIAIDETIINLEATKAAIEIPSPISGEIIAKNDQAESQPESLNSTNPAENWIVKIRVQGA